MRDMDQKVAEGIDCEIPALPKNRFNMAPSEDGIIVRLKEVGEIIATSS